MEKEYYIVEGDSRVGPLSILQLAERGIEPSTLVWTAGMADWTRADCVPELSHLLSERTRIDPPYSQRQYGAFGSAPQQPAGFPGPQTNWKTLAIVATVLGFFFSCIGGIIGIFAIVQANKAQNAMRYGDGFTARSAWSTCRTLCIVSFVLTGLGLIANIFYFKQFASILNTL